MELTRTFHPIGQGGFYTETFDDLPYEPMIVFDCGGNSSRSMKNYIDSFLPDDSKKIIEAVFVSHLHADHINGLQYLIERAEVKRIFLPQFTRNHVFNVFLYNASHSSQGYRTDKFILSLIRATKYGYNRGETSIIQVEEAEENHDITEKFENLQTLNSNILTSGTFLTIEDRWVYIPFNPLSKIPDFNAIDKYSVRIELEEIYEEKDICQQAELLAQFIESLSVDECKKIYKQLFSIHNGQSMTLFSGLINPTLDIRVRCRLFDLLCYDFYSHHHHCCLLGREKYVPTNFLYMGDYEADRVVDLEGFYRKLNVWDTICGIQIPHHGSRKNYANILYNERCYAVASAGKTNKFHHPNIDTLTNIFQQGCMPFVVTEDKNTIIIQQFKF